MFLKNLNDWANKVIKQGTNITLERKDNKFKKSNICNSVVI